MLGTRQTVAKMVAMIRAAIKNSAVRTVALSIVQDVPERDTMAQVDAIFAWVQENFSYVKDPVGVESLSRPEYMLRQIAEVGIARGDCDDVTMLLCALVGVLGIPSRVRVIQFAGYPGFSHVVAAVELAPGVYVEYDGTKRAGMVSALPVIGRAETETIIP